MVDQDKDENLPDSPKKEKKSDASTKDNENQTISEEESLQNEKSNLQHETFVEDISKTKNEEDHGTTNVTEEFHSEAVSHGGEETLNVENEVIDGITRLSRGDDPHWLSDAQCFIRQELTEVFSASDKDIEIGGVSQRGQVGIRCLYCAKNKPLEDRQSGHVYYPSSVSQIQQAVSDLQRRYDTFLDMDEVFEKNLRSIHFIFCIDTSNYVQKYQIIFVKRLSHSRVTAQRVKTTHRNIGLIRQSNLVCVTPSKDKGFNFFGIRMTKVRRKNSNSRKMKISRQNLSSCAQKIGQSVLTISYY